MISLVVARQQTGLVLFRRQRLLRLVVEKDADDDEASAQPAHDRHWIVEKQH